MELIKISERNGKKAVSARELYSFLDVKSKFNDWFKSQSDRAMLDENADYVAVAEKKVTAQGNESEYVDYALSINSAKEIAMLNGGDKGKQARLYFIECEKKLQKVLSPAEILMQQAQMMLDIERGLSNVETRLDKIEQLSVYNAPVEHMSVMGYCHNIGKKIDSIEGSKLSRKCKKICTDQGLLVGKVTDPRWGSVNTYPISVLEDVIGKME